MKALSSRRCTLEPQIIGHAEELYAVLNDPSLYKFIKRRDESFRDFALRLSRLESRTSPDGDQKWLNWVIRVNATLEIAGYVQATVFANSDECLIAYVLGRNFWGQGIGGEATDAMVRDLRETYGICSFVAILASENRRSQRLLERLGFYPVSRDGLDPTEIAMRLQCADSN